MKLIFLLVFLFSTYSVLFSQPKKCKIIISMKGIQKSKISFISLYSNNSQSGNKLVKKIKVDGVMSIISLNVSEPFWGFISLIAHDSVIMNSSSFLITNSTIKIDISSFDKLPVVTGGENNFINKHRLLLFALPDVIARTPGYSLKTIRETYEFNPADFRLKFYWREYEANIIEEINARKNYYFLLERLSSIKNTLPIKTLENCFSLFTDTLKKTSLGRELKLYIERCKKIALEENASFFKVWNEFGQTIPSDSIYSKSKFTLLDFWASWCMPCREEMRKLKMKYADIDTSLLQVVSISIDEKKNNWKAASIFENIPWKSFIDTTGTVQRTFALDYIPQNIIIDSSGRYVAFNLWGTDLDFFLKKNNFLKNNGLNQK